MAENDSKKSDAMRVKILTSGALINTEEGTRAGLYDEVDVDRERGEYLCEIGAAAPLDGDAPAPAPAGGATATDPHEAARLKAEQEAAAERQEREEEQARRRRPQPRSAPKAPGKSEGK